MENQITIQEKIAYLAGIIDGEGYMGINKGNKGKYNIVNNYKIRLCVTNTKKSIMDWLVENFGGAVYVRRVKNIKHVNAYQWTLFCANAARVIEMVYPYLVIKRKQAEIILAYRKIQESGIKTCPGKRAVPESLRAEIMNTVKLLNGRGSESVTTNTPDISNLLMKIESELNSNVKNRVSDNLVAH